MKGFRWPRRRPKAAAGTGKGSSLLRLLAALGVLLLGFLLGLYLFFPVETLKTRIESEVAARTPVQLQIGQLGLTFPPGLRATRVLLGGDLPTRLPELDSVTTKPLWSALVSGKPGLAVEARKGEGTLSLDAVRGGALTAAAENFPLDLALSGKSKLQLAATVKKADLESALRLQRDTASRLQLSLSGIALSGMSSLGAKQDVLKLGTLNLEVTGKGQTFQVAHLESTGGDLQISGEGQILVAFPLARSRVNLTLIFKPAPGLDPGLADLLGLVARKERDGAFHLHLRGTLAQAGLG